MLSMDLDEFPIHPMPPGEYDGMKETSNLPEEVIHLMPDRVSPGPLCGNHPPKEAVCIHTRKVYDSCREGQEPSYRKKTRSGPAVCRASDCGETYIPYNEKIVCPALHQSAKSRDLCVDFCTYQGASVRRRRACSPLQRLGKVAFATFPTCSGPACCRAFSLF